MENYYISTVFNKDFLHQRILALKKNKKDNFSNIIQGKKKREIGKIFFFTLDNESIKKISKIKNQSKLKKIVLIEVIHTASILSNKIYTNKFYFSAYYFYQILKFKVKLFKFAKLFNVNVDLRYIYVVSNYSSIKQKNIIKIPSNKLIFSEPYFDKRKLLQKKNSKLKFSKRIFLFDSHFPLHPDSYPRNKLNNKKIILQMIDLYFTYLKENIFDNYSKEKINIFLHPRTYENLFKDEIIKKYVYKIFPKNIFFYSGILNFLKNFKKFNNNDKIYVQYGSQLSLLKNLFLKRKISNVHILELNSNFLISFKKIRNKFKDMSNLYYLKNYYEVEIKPFINVKKNLFKKFS